MAAIGSIRIGITGGRSAVSDSLVRPEARPRLLDEAPSLFRQAR